ncbi:Uncharacterised protein [Candidatus Tiddalikarchaeum anstoanum]|nr:Uncharacterised protein [Candidatus Tiddalikarchaeum anstoanum]
MRKIMYGMNLTETLYVTSKEEWRKWLEKNHDKKTRNKHIIRAVKNAKLNSKYIA